MSRNFHRQGEKLKRAVSADFELRFVFFLLIYINATPRNLAAILFLSLVGKSWIVFFGTIEQSIDKCCFCGMDLEVAKEDLITVLLKIHCTML